MELGKNMEFSEEYPPMAPGLLDGHGRVRDGGQILVQLHLEVVCAL